MQIAGIVNQKLEDNASLVVTAPPGAGKSTLLPLTILESLKDGGKILMLEPRRLATRQIAERMAELLGERVGQTVGYRVRFESCVSEDTRVEVVTEGILTRMLISDPTLEGVSVVIFDEFHERSINSDVALALTREAQGIIRPDLRIVIMSATIDATAICQALHAPLVESEGRMYPVEIIHEDTDITECSKVDDIALAVARSVMKAHANHEGDILVFLPGQAEITKCAEILAHSLPDTNICPLYGLLSSEAQRKAIAPSDEGERKVVLATPIAETSLTIEGVRIVVDSGLCRKMTYSPQNALSHLDTVRISMDMATQRTGRAGRVAPGVCYRLWSLATEHRMSECRIPEILEADLTPMSLDICAWGEADISRLPWLTPPPTGNLAQARELLIMLQAIDESGCITAHGKELATLPCHPRIAQMLTTADSPQMKVLACDIASLLENKDIINTQRSSAAPASSTITDADINSRIALLCQSRNRYPFISRIAEQYRRLVKTKECNEIPHPHDVGKLIASAYPERIAKAEDEGLGRFKLANGNIASLDPNDELSAQEWLAVASLGSKIFLASPLNINDIQHLIRSKDNLSWDNKQGAILARRERRIGRLLIDSMPIQGVKSEDIIRTLCESAPKYGTSMFSFDEKVQNLQRRICIVAQWHPEMGLPDVSTEAVLNRASDWLFTTDIHKVNMGDCIWSLLSYEQQQLVDSIAPTHIRVPSGSKIKVEYRQGAEQPILRVRLQECFGLQDTPCIDEGRQPVLMELLSPGFKPVQLTQDLHSFWENTYFEVRKELRRRYPKHSWPDDPLKEEAVRGVKKK